MENADKWFAIVNPVAGSGRGLADWPQISKLLRDNHIVPEYAFTERKYHAIELAVEAVNNGFRKIIVVGGDGTILHLARTVALHNVPVLGINLGSLGFMSELEPNELERLRDLKSWDFAVESRMMLDVSVLRGGKSVYNNIALNDAVISKGSIARVVRLNIFTEEGQLTKVGGDGIIASTPTGSTGYSMAAGGPIVEPTARNLLLTPICPHSTRSSSYVLSPEHVITVEAPDANRKFVYLSVDGGKAFSLKNNDQVRVSTSRYTTKLVRLSKKSFCEILDKKMGGEVTKA